MKNLSKDYLNWRVAWTKNMKIATTLPIINTQSEIISSPRFLLQALWEPSSYIFPILIQSLLVCRICRSTKRAVVHKIISPSAQHKSTHTQALLLCLWYVHLYTLLTSLAHNACIPQSSLLQTFLQSWWYFPHLYYCV